MPRIKLGALEADSPYGIHLAPSVARLAGREQQGKRRRRSGDEGDFNQPCIPVILRSEPQYARCTPSTSRQLAAAKFDGNFPPAALRQ